MTRPATTAKPKSRAAHTYQADPSVGPMLRFERSLPRLPVPTLSSTCAKYLETVRPHLDAKGLARTTKAVEAFQQSPLAKDLQQRLEARAAQPEMTNWLADWWDEVAYMGYRDPVVVYVSYFYVHAGRAESQAARAAGLLRAMMAFRDIVETQQLEPDKVRDAPLAMSSFKWLFHACRYPVKPSDTAKKFDPATHNHIVVLRKNRFFEVPLTAPDGSALSTGDLQAQIQHVIDTVGNNKAIPIGALTSDNRDLWADAREKLASSPNNTRMLERIESAMVLVCLDETTPAADDREKTSWACWTGDGRNRFYDKHQLIVFENGRSGFMGEHSCMDGTPTLRMNEFILGALAAGKIDHGKPASAPLPPPAELTFEVNDEVKSLVHSAEERFDALVSKHDLEVLHYTGYGKGLIKTFKVSPDAWAQVVKQLAFTRMFGRAGVCYESCQTRKFARGRTEVIRAASAETAAFAAAMDNNAVTDEMRVQLLRAANIRHVQYAAWAADGQGVDRHLFGLKRMLKEGEPVPEIYEDPAYSQTNHWELSTSQLSSPWVDGWGYGEVVEDGYGLSYAIGDDYLRWTITSLKRDTAKLKQHLQQAADDMRALMERVAANAPKAKM